MSNGLALRLAAALMLIPAAPVAAELSRPEQVMVRTVDAEQERTVAMLGRWVDQNSGTMNFAGVKDRQAAATMRRAGRSTSPSISRQAKRAAILMSRLAGERR